MQVLLQLLFCYSCCSCKPGSIAGLLVSVHSACRFPAVASLFDLLMHAH
jgi:hypothetical protein